MDDHTVLGRALEIVDAVSALGPLSLADLTAAVGIPKPTTRRIAEELTRRGVLARDSGRYSIGERPATWAASAGSRFDDPHTESALVELTKAVGGMAWVAAPDEKLKLTLRRGIAADDVAVQPTDAWPVWNLGALIHTAGGRLLLAGRPDVVAKLEEVPFPRTTSSAPNSVRSLQLVLHQVNESGVSLETGQFMAGWRCAAVNVPPGGTRQMILGVSVPAARSDAQLMIRTIRKLADDISRHREPSRVTQ